MEKLIDAVNNLKKVLDETEVITEIKQLNSKVLQDKELLSLIAKYNETNDERLKEQIISNELFKKYKHNEAELNFLILEINSKLKDITKKDKCGL